MPIFSVHVTSVNICSKDILKVREGHREGHAHQRTRFSVQIEKKKSAPHMRISLLHSTPYAYFTRFSNLTGGGGLLHRVDSPGTQGASRDYELTSRPFSNTRPTLLEHCRMFEKGLRTRFHSVWYCLDTNEFTNTTFRVVKMSRDILVIEKSISSLA
jgi:hypothetical protein